MITRFLRSGTVRDWAILALGLAVMGGYMLLGSGPF